MSRPAVQAQPDLTRTQRFSAPDQTAARSSVGLADLPTVVALGPFDDPAHAYQLAAAFTSVQRTCPAQLVLLGMGPYRSAVVRYAAEHGVHARVLLAEGLGRHRLSKLLAAADVVVSSTASTSMRLLEVLATGRPVVAPANAVSARLLLPNSAGLVYQQGDVSGMAAALLRVLTVDRLRNEMTTRAIQVARRHELQRFIRQRSEQTLNYA
jgi:glycosyltransferase involved in cell wall biosynthesis